MSEQLLLPPKTNHEAEQSSEMLKKALVDFLDDARLVLGGYWYTRSDERGTTSTLHLLQGDPDAGGTFTTIQETGMDTADSGVTTKRYKITFHAVRAEKTSNEAYTSNNYDDGARLAKPVTIDVVVSPDGTITMEYENGEEAGKDNPGYAPGIQAFLEDSRVIDPRTGSETDQTVAEMLTKQPERV